ncbi:peptidase S15 [Roseovarius sp. A46]|uniref:CocE/NonD family hydrolase n=1 Tax=Roseovarius sp. A46 TaxID=2109331 RepID=UPI0010133633|nr:CocE/NonD family hydrolase [Roseovarius sp. A46]RXV58535.1 peptidase S15 [Roseovarius sp. A46]
MKHVDVFPYEVTEISHLEIPMRDGCKLAARIWMPKGAPDAPVPAILEYLPYRKNDFTTMRDASMQPYLAGHGYAVIRLDLRGSGDSEGLMVDEYLPQELQDGCDAIDWIARQPWCDGKVGMIGISWGGFNGLQIAALQPPALKAVVTLCSTDDRYADDIHYMGGCLLGEQLSWASIMFGRNTLPPDPANVGDRWRDMWLERLEGSGLWLKNWLGHQRRDEFWRHGSICEDWSRVRVPVYAVSGWADGYCRSVFRLMENLQGPKKGLVGPWAHRYPHLGEPGPAIGFLQEELRWWDHWLKGQDTGIMNEPMLRLFVQESVPPRGHYDSRPGRWIAEREWPSPQVARTLFHLTPGGELSLEYPNEIATLTHLSPADVGMASGKWCGYGAPGDAPVDQRREDAGSLCFEIEVPEEGLTFAGDANVHLRLSVDRPVAQIAARLVDVHPDGRATRLCFGALNLTHRGGHDRPEPLVPGEVYDVTVPMKPVAQSLPVGHRLRLALSTSYFPMIWPAPEPVTLSIHTGGSALDLPLRGPSPLDDMLPAFDPPEAGPPPVTEQIIEPESYFRIVEDAAGNEMQMQIAEGGGVTRLLANDITMHKQGYETYGVPLDDVTAAWGRTEWHYGLSRGDWSVRSETRTELRADAQDFIVTAELRAWEGDDLVAEKRWEERIARDHM